MLAQADLDVVKQPFKVVGDVVDRDSYTLRFKLELLVPVVVTKLLALLSKLAV